MEGAQAAAARTDLDLIERVQHGDPVAFASLHDRFVGRMLSLAARICGRECAEDAVQAAFASAWLDRRRYSPARGTVSAWLCMYARQRAVDTARREGRHRTNAAGAGAELLSLSERDGPLRRVLAREEADIVAGLLDGVPPAQRRVIELAYFSGLSHQEIALSLQLPVGTAKSRKRLGLERMRRAVRFPSSEHGAATLAARPVPPPRR